MTDIGFLHQLWQTLLSTLRDVMPIAGILFGFQLFVIRQAIPNLKRVTIGFVLVILGLTLFLMDWRKRFFLWVELWQSN